MKGNQPGAQPTDASNRQQDPQNATSSGTNQQPSQKREIQISQATRERAEALKAYVESICY